MKDDKDYINDIYAKYEQEKDKTTVFFKQNIKKRPRILTNVATMLIVMVLATTGVFAGIKIYEKIYMKPSFSQEFTNVSTNQMWCGTFQLVWNDLMNDMIGGPVEFVEYESKLANELNKQSFTSNMLTDNSYYKIWGKRNIELKNTIKAAIKEKFNEESQVLENVQWDSPIEGYVLYAMLKKEFHFVQAFDILNNDIFGDSIEKVKYFGIDKKHQNEKLYKNVEVLFYNSNVDFAVKLKTKENEEVILYRTNDNTSFEDKYIELNRKAKVYDKNVFTSNDTLKVPYINVQSKINYDELCDKTIKGTDLIIVQALQTIDIQIDNKGGKLVSKAIIEAEKNAFYEDIDKDKREFNFNDNFVMFLKEADKEKPYFAIFVNDAQVLVK